MASLPIAIPSNAMVIPVNLSSMSKTFTLPVVSTNQGRMLIFKDYYGNSANSTIRLSTIGLDRIERSGVSSMALSIAFGAWTFMNDGATKWFLTDVYQNTLAVIAPSGGLIGVFHLAPTGTFPAFTGTSPTFGPSFVSFNGGASQYIDFGPKVFNLGTLGFSLKTKIVWTAYNTWARVIDFNSGGSGNQDMFLTLPGTGSSPLRFQYKEGGEQITDWGGTISLNTLYTIAVVYNPNVGGANGQTKIFVNGALVVTNNSMGAKGTDKNYAFTYVGKSSYGADAYLGANIYSLDVFNRALTDAEALS